MAGTPPQFNSPKRICDRLLAYLSLHVNGTRGFNYHFKKYFFGGDFSVPLSRTSVVPGDQKPWAASCENSPIQLHLWDRDGDVWSARFGEKWKTGILVAPSEWRRQRFKVSFPNPWQKFQREGAARAKTAAIRIHWLFVIQVFTSGRDLPTEDKIFQALISCCSLQGWKWVQWNSNVTTSFKLSLGAYVTGCVFSVLYRYLLSCNSWPLERSTPNSQPHNARPSANSRTEVVPSKMLQCNINPP